MFKKTLTLIAFLAFGWFGASQNSIPWLNSDEYSKIVSDLESGNPNPFSVEKLFAQMGLNFFEPLSTEFNEAMNSLKEDISNYCQSLDQETLSDEDQKALLESAQISWKKAMKSYYFLNTVPFGPLLENGKGLANDIYSWPLMNECGFHTEMLSLKNSGVFSKRVFFTSKGLMAVEFSLFGGIEETACNSVNKKYKPVHNWLTLDPKEKMKDLCAFGLKVTEEIALTSVDLKNEWSSEGGNYMFTLLSGAKFSDYNEALESIAHELYIKVEFAKDAVIGKPLGLHADCLDGSGLCLDMTENKWSQSSFETLESHFEGFRKVFEEGGLGQYLTFLGHEDAYLDLMRLNDNILSTIADLKTQGSFYSLVSKVDAARCKQTTTENRLEPVCALHKDVRALSQALKYDFFAVLNLNPPLALQGEAD